MERYQDFEIVHGNNYRVLRTRDFGNIVFGCPPGIVKDFAKRKEELPNQFVIPAQTFVNGRSNFDLEFIVYSFLFLKIKRKKIFLYCSRQQEQRFRSILNETLFGPRFVQNIQAQFRKIPTQYKFSPVETRRFTSFLNKVAADESLFDSFDGLLRDHYSDASIFRRVRGYFEMKLNKEGWLAQKNISGLTSKMARNYIICAQLKKEMDLFGLVEEEGRGDFLDTVISFSHFNNKGRILLKGERDKKKNLEIAQRPPFEFDVFSKGRLMCHVDTFDQDPAHEVDKVKPIEKPCMGVTFIGVGSGFSPKRHNSCFIIWSEDKGIMVDAEYENKNLILRQGITEKDVPYMLLTHVHSDHDSGVSERILGGQRLKLITTRIIFESFLRKMEAITSFPQEVIESLVDFIEMEPHKPIRIPGFKHTLLTFDYSFHSIPCARFIVEYSKNGVHHKISHSGDTKFDPNKINDWYEQGIFSKKRRDNILGFIWDADIILHEAGGGKLHTSLHCLNQLDERLSNKVIIFHQHKNPTTRTACRFAVEGQTEVLIRGKAETKRSGLDRIKEVALFKGLKKNHVAELLAHSKLEHRKSGEIICSQKEKGDSFYVILDGFAEVFMNGKPLAIYEKGNFFGELVITTKNPYRRATIKAKGPLTLLKIPQQFYRKFDFPPIQDEFYNLSNYFSDIISPGLLSTLAFGKVKRWNKHDTIIPSGEKDPGVYVILSGRINVLNKNNRSVALLRCGDVVGKISGLKNVLRQTTFQAQSDVVSAINLKNHDLDKVFKLFPSFYGTVYLKMKKIEAGLQ